MKSDQVLKSIFLRKGGEGKFSSIRLNESKNLAFDYWESDSKYLRINEGKIIIKNEFTKNEEIIVNLREIKSCKPAFELESKRGKKSPSDFSLLIVTTINNNEFIAEVEKGQPFKGIHQLLNNLGNSPYSSSSIE